MSEQVKPCASCRHCQNHPRLSQKEYSICTRPGLPQRIDMITGEPMLDMCSIQRLDASSYCGLAAVFFEPIVDNFDELTVFREKSIDWWTTRSAFSRYMYEEAAERGYNADKARQYFKEYSNAKSHFEKKYNEPFAFDLKPLDVSEKAPSGVDTRIGA